MPLLLFNCQAAPQCTGGKAFQGNQPGSSNGDYCQVFEDASEPLRGRPKKRKAPGRPSEDDTHHHNRKLMHHLSTLEIPSYSDSSLHISRFLKSPHFDYLTCKICSSIPNQPLQILSCSHFLCLSCTEHLLNQNETLLSCPCSDTVISTTDLRVPSGLPWKVCYYPVTGVVAKLWNWYI